MKKFVLSILLFTVLSGFSQEIEKIELTQEEIEYLAKDIYGGMFKPKSDDYENSVKNNLINYAYEIFYDNKLIYRGAIKKPSLSGINYGMNRKNASFCFEYDIFDSETKLELAENKNGNWKNKRGEKIFVY